MTTYNFRYVYKRKRKDRDLTQAFDTEEQAKAAAVALVEFHGADGRMVLSISPWSKSNEGKLLLSNGQQRATYENGEWK